MSGPSQLKHKSVSPTRDESVTAPVHVAMFYHDGRGPQLQRVHWNQNGTLPLAIDYYNPDDEYDEATLKHVLVLGPQVIMITPEEVIDYRGSAGQSRHHNQHHTSPFQQPQPLLIPRVFAISRSGS
ncbi:MAG TPA: hypothetical protein VF331_20365 [Polyangiales bacterium]